MSVDKVKTIQIMQLHVIESYRMDGQDFRSLKQAQKHLESEIGKILDATPLRMEPKQALAVFEAIVKNKQRLCELLSVEVESEDWNGQSRNLLDMDL